MDCTPIFRKTVKGAADLMCIESSTITAVLMAVADRLAGNSESIFAENQKDLAKMDPGNSLYDRLNFTSSRIATAVRDIRNIASLPSPAGRVLYSGTKENGLRIRKISVPFGVVGIIYEARPNVTSDVFSLCLKSGNACILKGGSDAINTNSAIVNMIKSTLAEFNVNPDIVNLLPSGREETIQMLNARNYIDLIIPRGSQGLIEYVRNNSLIPVIETGAGICHTYFDESGDRAKGREIINNAKTRRVSVCNALDCLVIHESRLSDLPYLVGLCADKEVVIYADEASYKSLDQNYPEHLLMHAMEESYGTEFLSYKMSVRTVGSINGALDHIARYSSRHSEAIIAEDKMKIDQFIRQVDAAAVYANAPTSFTDGAEFGLGAEIGISTQKLHARGPMGLEELNTYKWVIEGEGQIRI